jgi:hypothetical protein
VTYGFSGFFLGFFLGFFFGGGKVAGDVAVLGNCGRDINPNMFLKGISICA